MEKASFAREPMIAYVVAFPNVDPVGQTHGTGFVLQGGRDFESGLPTTIAGSRTAAADMAWLNIALGMNWKRSAGFAGDCGVERQMWNVCAICWDERLLIYVFGL